MAQAVELKFKIHLYHKLATALSPSLRSFLRKTLSGQEYEEVINTLAALTETAGTEERARSLEKKQGPPREAVPSPTEVHDFFSFCVEKQQQEWDSGGISESWGRQFVVQYMSDSKLTGFQSLLNFWHERSDGLVPVAKRLLAIPATSIPSERGVRFLGCPERGSGGSNMCCRIMAFSKHITRFYRDNVATPHLLGQGLLQGSYGPPQ
ncbi:uncharacterized protein LOC119421929 [Nematolebias whitei]|uniref:uncharacterized protein LOC119421929 n=1 Tax=Nematolebias whitei TaxID=451745 RepID=UPI00189BA95E|nr:uncharacterized protein LOC119421929 [Nematolebias whitei]